MGIVARGPFGLGILSQKKGYLPKNKVTSNELGMWKTQIKDKFKKSFNESGICNLTEYFSGLYGAVKPTAIENLYQIFYGSNHLHVKNKNPLNNLPETKLDPNKTNLSGNKQSYIPLKDVYNKYKAYCTLQYPNHICDKIIEFIEKLDSSLGNKDLETLFKSVYEEFYIKYPTDSTILTPTQVEKLKEVVADQYGKMLQVYYGFM